MDDGFSDLESADGEHEVEATMNKQTDIKTSKHVVATKPVQTKLEEPKI